MEDRMSLKLESSLTIPKETSRVAKAVFPNGNVYITLRDKMGSIFVDNDFVDLFAKRGQPAIPPWRLALITIFHIFFSYSGFKILDTGVSYALFYTYPIMIIAWAGST